MPGLLDRFSDQSATPEPTEPQPGSLLSRFDDNAAPSVEEQPLLEQEPQQQLPKGAKGFDPYGNPYFGEGIGGILKKWQYNFTKDVKDVSDDEWRDLRERWKQSFAAEKKVRQEEGFQFMPGQLPEGQQAVAQQQTKLAGETVSKLWQSGQSGEGFSPLAPVLKGISASVTALGELFSIPAQKLEQGIGAVQGFKEAAAELDSPLPRLDQNMLTKAIEDMPLGMAYDFARIALSSSEDKWDYTKQKISDGWQAGRIFYSQVFDATLKQRFLQEYREGKDPALIAMKLQNPWAELGGQLILDPLNLVGAFGKASKTAKELDAAMEATTTSGLLKTEAGKTALQAIQEAADDVSGARALDNLVTAQTDVVSTISQKSKLLNVGYSVDSLTTTSRQNAIVTKGKQLLGNMALVLKERGVSYDAIGEAILSGIRSTSANADEMRKGLAGLAQLPNANMWLADDYVESFIVLRNMMEGADGVIDGGRLKRLTQIKNPAEFSEQAAKLYLSAAKGQFKEVSEMEEAYKIYQKAEKAGGVVSEETKALALQYEQLPTHVKYMDRINNALKTVTNPINRVLFPAYFNLQGGVAMRNIFTNVELVALDKGVGAFFKDGKYWSLDNVKEYINGIYGMLPESAHGFKSLVSSMTDRPSWGFGKIMEAGEEAAATRIVGASIRDTFKKMLPKAMPDLAKEIEAGTLTGRQAGMLMKLVERNGYNVQKAVEEFREIYKVGSVEDWRNLDFVTDFEREALEGLDLWRDVDNLARMGATSPDDVEKVFQKLRTVIDERAKFATKDVVGLSPDHPGVETWGDLIKAAEEGHLDPDLQNHFTAIMEYAEQVRMEYQDLLDDVVMKAQQALNAEGRAQEATRISQEMNRVRSVIRRAGKITAKDSYEITQDAWRWSNEVNTLKKATPEKLAEYWSRAGLPGDPPMDLNKGRFFKALWQERFRKVSELWNASFDGIVAESETVLSQMDGVIDTAELESMASRTRWLTKQAQATRTGVFKNGSLKLMPKKDLAFVAKQYGVSTDEIIQAINNQKGTAYQTIDELETADIMEVIKQARNERGLSTTVGRPKATQAATAATEAPKVDLTSAPTTPVHELPPTVQERFELVARSLLNELSGGEAGKRISTTEMEGGAQATKWKGVSTTNVDWYRKLYESGVKSKKVVESALQKIIEDGGKDKGVNVERMKELIVDRFRFGDPETGAPPDLYVLQQLGADDKIMQEALDTFNDMTRQELSLEDVLAKMTPTEELLRNKDQPYFDELGNLVEPQGVEIPPPHPTGTTPSDVRVWNESAKDAKHVLDNIKNGILERWGKTNAENVPSAQMDEVLGKVAQTLEPRIGEMKAVALRIAEQQRNFTLLNYGEKTYGDMIKAYVLPFHFFYSKSYKNWIHRLANDPEIIANFGRYNEFLESENKDLPDWYKRQLNINPFAENEDMKGKTFLGIPLDHPLYINLEATFNPLNGLTGVDYNDPVKRNNWFTATMDDMGKFGPTMYAPIQLGIAAYMFRNGESEVAARWAGRLFPETAQAKALTSTLFGKPVELDPAVNFFSGGIDTQERGRMAYAAAQLIQSGQFTPEQIMMEFQAQEGDAWDAAYQMAVQSRAASSFTSYFLGVGFKPRSVNDVKVEEMYTDLNKLYAMADMMTPENYRMAWEQLRSKHPAGFVDAVLLARKGGEKRDAALAYEVLNRLPPGNLTEALASIGLSQKEISKFYDSKGFTDKKVKFTKQEKDRFMAAIIDMATMLKIPESATRQEWAEAKSTYSLVYKQVEEDLGEDIWDKVSQYYDLKDDNRVKAQQFAALHPEIFTAMQMKREAVLATPVLSAYYAGLETIETYLDGKIRQQLSDKYGANIYNIQTGYYDAANPKAYLKAHPELKSFWNEKRRLEAESDKAYLSLASKLPEGKPAEFQEGFSPQSDTQEQLYEALQPEEKIPSWEEVSQGMPEWLQQEIANYAANGGKLSKRGQKELDYLADVGNYYNADSLLRVAMLSMQQPSPEEPQSSGLLSRFAGP